MDKNEFKKMLKETIVECFETGDIKLELKPEYDEDSILYNSIELSIDNTVVVKQRIKPIKC